MKVEAFVEILRPYAAIVDAHGATRLAAQINSLKDVWAPIMSWNVKDLLKRAWPAESLPEADEATVEEFREALIRLQDVIKTVAKQDVVKDLSAVIAALQPHDREDLDLFIKACRAALEAATTSSTKTKSSKKPGSGQAVSESVVVELVQRLKETYTDPQKFLPLYERLSSDKAITQAELAAVATEFAYETPSKTKRAESLRRIWLVHESYATSAAKSKFSGGKSAA